MSYVCETCHTSFKTRGNLTAHVKTARYCISLRTAVPAQSEDLLCTICNNRFSKKSNLQKHFNSCSSHTGYIKYKELYIQLQAKLDATITEKDKHLDATILDKNKQIEAIALERDRLRLELHQLSLEAVRRPTTIHNINNNTNINNLAVFVKSDLIKAIELFPITKQIMNDGVPGVAKHVGTLMKTQFEKPNYIVTNEAKQKFTYKLEDGTVRKDFKSKLIIDSVGPNISVQATSIYNSTLSKYELISKIKDLELTKIPQSKKNLLDLEERLLDFPRNSNNSAKTEVEDKIESSNTALRLLLDDLQILKRECNKQGLCLDVPIDFYEHDLDITSQSLRKIKNLQDHNKSFSKTLIETII